MSIKTLQGRLERRREQERTKGKIKDPRYWPFCISCHLAAPEGKPPARPLSSYVGPGDMVPETETWAKLGTPDGKGTTEYHWLCPDCTAFVLVQVERNQKAVKQKLEKIAAAERKGERCGLRLANNLNPFKSAFCSKPKGHTDACG